MGAGQKYARIVLGIVALAGALAATGCSMHSSARSNVHEVVVGQPSDVPGVVEYVWEEPMVDVIDVPPGLDPEGHYYRPAHQSIVEIRQGRWNYYKGK